MPSPHPTYTTPLESLSLVYYQYIQQQCLEKEREDINLVFSTLLLKSSQSCLAMKQDACCQNMPPKKKALKEVLKINQRCKDDSVPDAGQTRTLQPKKKKKLKNKKIKDRT